MFRYSLSPSEMYLIAVFPKDSLAISPQNTICAVDIEELIDILFPCKVKNYRIILVLFFQLLNQSY